MANASRKHIGPSSQGKGDGRGGLIDEIPVPESAILSNRDKKQHSQARGEDTKWTKTEQLRDHELNQEKE